METSLSRSYSSLRFNNEPHPGCMWGLFHLLDFHHRHNAKKKHPSKRFGGGRRTKGAKYSRLKQPHSDTGCELEASIEAELDNVQIEENMPSTIPACNESDKDSMEKKTAEDNRVNRHQLPSFPSRFQRIHSIHHLEPSHHHLPDEVREDAEGAKTDLPQVACLSATQTSDPRLPNLPAESVASCKQSEVNDTPGSVRSLGCNQLNELGKQLLDQALLHGKLGKSGEALLKKKQFDTAELCKDPALYQSKEFMDSLEILNVNESFLKILEDQNFYLAHHVPALQASNAKTGLTKSGSFPVSDSPSRMPRKLKQNSNFARQEGRSQSGNLTSLLTRAKSFEETNALHMNLVRTEAHETFTSPFPGPFYELKKQGENQVVTNRFKNFKQRIKHAIKGGRKGRRISMDAILHKIPYGRSFSKNAKREITDQWKECVLDDKGIDSPRAESVNDISVSTLGKGGQSHIRRARSLNESLEKYSELFKSSFGHEAKLHHTDKFKLINEDGSPLSSPKSLGRIRSLPNIESSYFIQSEVSVDDVSSDTPTTAPLDRGTSTERISFSEQRSPGLPLSSEHDTQLDALFKSESITSDRPLMESMLENNGHGDAELNDSIDDTSNLDNGESGLNSRYEQEPGPANSKITKPPQPSPISVLESCFQEDVISPAKFSISEGMELEPRHIDFDELGDMANVQDQSTMEESLNESGVAADLGKVISVRMQLANDFPHVQVDRKDEANFNYVKDVLKLSRFSGNEYLGTWHSPEWPVDPSLFEEVETSSPPKSRGTAEEIISSHDQQILFDIINEVLLEIYDKSFSYWPQPLSCNCRIRPMPKGYHVLEEVWCCMHWYLNSQPELDPSMDYVVARDISKDDGWMNLQFDSECVGIELEEMIWDDLLEEVMYT